MTERHAGYIVSLDTDLRADDAQVILQALHQIKGVIKVEPVVLQAGIHIAQARAERRIEQRLWKALHDGDPQTDG